MAKANVLPDMDEPRLRNLGKQLNRSRKSSIIHNDKLKERLVVYEKSLNRAKRSVDGKYAMKGQRLKNNLVRVRGTQKCLRIRREQSFWEDTEEYPYGVYEGESLASYRREVDNIIEKKHPKYRRMKKVEEQLKTGKTTGKILDNEDAKMQFEILMRDGPRNQYKYMHRENPLNMTFYGDSNKNKDFNLLKSKNRNDTFLREGLPPIGTSKLDTFSPSPLANSPSEESESTLDDYLTVRSSPSKLHLPAIAVDKDFMKNKTRGMATHVPLPNLAIRRASKHESNERNQLQTLAKLKGRRATTFI